MNEQRSVAMRLLAAGLAAGLALVLTGCGQKGPLTLPSAPAGAASAASSPAASPR